MPKVRFWAIASAAAYWASAVDASSSQECPADMPSGVCRAQSQDQSQSRGTTTCPAGTPTGACRSGAAAPRPSSSNTQTKGKNPQQEEENESYEPPPHVECHVFMAPSTLGEDTNMGVYTGKPLKEGDVVNYPELVIPLMFREWGHHPTEFGKDAKLWDRYIWEGTLMNIESYEDTNRENSRAAFVPGVGCTVNSVLDMQNVNSTRGSKFDTAGLHRTRDPGSGAFSPYHASETVVVRNISEGTELLANYGDYWIPEIPGAQISLRKLMIEAEDFLQKEYIPFVLDQQRQHNFSAEMKEALWQFTVDFPVYSQALSNLPKSHPWKDVEEVIRQKRNEQQQQQQQKQRQKRKPKGESVDQDDDKRQHAERSVVQAFLRKQQVRPLSWLYEHGWCQDHLVPGRSTIEQAGRGAFAARKLPKGAIVGYAPLIHIGVHGRDLWTIEYPNTPGTPGRRQYDLVLNYSFGHPNSTVILTPYGGMVNYINHNSQAPNVRVRWPQQESVAHKPHWLKQDPLFLRDTVDKIGLSFEYVALRDIEPGEEVFMDYGPEWEAAWHAHVLNWQPLANADDFALVEDVLMNREEPYLRTVHELFDNPYPQNIAVLCVPSYTAIDPPPPLEISNGRPTFQWLPLKLWDVSKIKQRLYCVIVERYGPSGPSKDEYTYTVDLKVNAENESTRWIRVLNVTSEGVALYNLAFSHDWHMPNVFRHPIGIPDKIMPRSWFNEPILETAEFEY